MKSHRNSSHNEFSDIPEGQGKTLNEGSLGLQLTQHAKERMCRRRITSDDIRVALDYGKIYNARGAVIYAIGKKSLEHYRSDQERGSKLDGLQVVCSYDGTILTAYRNKDLSKLKPRRSRRRRALGGIQHMGWRRDTFRRLDAR